MKRLALTVLDALGLLPLADALYSRVTYLADPSLVRRNTAFRMQGAPDGLPLPPPHLAFLVSGGYDLDFFYRNGRTGAECIRTILEKNGMDISKFRRILDFGCGCGRVMRHWNALQGPALEGVDYNPRLIRWCRRALPFATFNVNKLDAALSHPDDTFDFIYAISVFTHLPLELQQHWIRELTRVLRPGGALFLTTLGTTRLSDLTPQERQQFDAGRPVVRHGNYRGSNMCAVYHPEQAMRELAGGLTIMDVVPGGAKDASQDVFLMRK